MREKYIYDYDYYACTAESKDEKRGRIIKENKERIIEQNKRNSEKYARR